MKESLQVVVQSIDALADDDLRIQARELLASWLPQATEAGMNEILEGFNRQATDTSVPARSQIRYLLGELASWLRPPLDGSFNPGQLALLKSLYHRLDTDWQTSQHVLLLFSLQGDQMALDILVELLVDSPPTDSTAVALVLGPLFASPPASLAILFPRLLEALAHPSIAASILDMANYLAREGLLKTHPAGDRIGQLETLLHGLNRHLDELQEESKEPAESLQQLQSKVADSVALAISLCVALALIGSDTSAAALRITCQQPHRRLRTEAAAALAQLGDEQGRSILLAMAAEPAVRLWVIQYAEELGIEDQLEPALVMPAARKESELALWLAQPQNVGVPPSSMQLVDERTQYWPGFNEPVDCFLFQFSYQFTRGEYQNTGIAAPLTAAVHANLGKMAFDDIYALFAGRDAEHEEIRRWEVVDLEKRHQAERKRLGQFIEESDFASIQPELFMQFFGDDVLVAQASKDGQEGLVVADFVDCLWFPEQDALRPLAAVDALNIYAGKKLLETFNA
jgi:HEAT repeat protein